MTREEARHRLLRQADALKRRGYDDAAEVRQAIDVLTAPVNRDEIMVAVNAGADLALDAIGRAGYRHLTPDDAYNLSSLIVNAIGSALDGPVTDMAEVMAANFDESTIGDWREELGDELVDQALALRGAA